MKKLLPLVLALVIFAGLVPAIETPAMAVESDAVIKVKMSGLYDIIVNPYRMVMQSQGGTTTTNESIVSDPCLITSETVAPLVIHATASVAVQGGVQVALEPIEKVGNNYAKSVFLFLELQELNSSNVNDVKNPAGWTKSVDFTAATNLVQILQSGSGTATITIPAATDTPSYAAVKISGDCSLPDQSNPWVPVAENEGDVVDGFSVTVTFSFEIIADFTVRFHFMDISESYDTLESWEPVKGTWDQVGVFVNGTKVQPYMESNMEYKYNVGQDLEINVVADVYSSNILPTTSGETVKSITEISYNLVDSPNDVNYIYTNNMAYNPDTNVYISYEGVIEAFSLNIGDVIDIYVIVQTTQGSGSDLGGGGDSGGGGDEWIL